MTDILDPNEPAGFQVSFENTAPGCILRYVSDGHSFALTRGEMQALYGRFQEIMADELIAAGWRNTLIKDSILYFEKDGRGELPLDLAHYLMMEAQNAD